MLKLNPVLNFGIIVLFLLLIAGLWFGVFIIGWSPAQSVFFIASTFGGVGAQSMDPFMYPYWVLNFASIYSIVAVIAGNVVIVFLSKQFRIAGTCRITSLKLWEQKNCRVDMDMLFPDNSSGNNEDSGSQNISPIADEELQYLVQLGIRRVNTELAMSPSSAAIPTGGYAPSNNPNSCISRQEFLVLSAIRLGLVSFSDVQHILESFDKLEAVDSTGKAPIQLLCGAAKLAV
jgi:hypothetical protein